MDDSLIMSEPALRDLAPVVALPDEGAGGSAGATAEVVVGKPAVEFF